MLLKYRQQPDASCSSPLDLTACCTLGAWGVLCGAWWGWDMGLGEGERTQRHSHWQDQGLNALLQLAVLCVG